MCLFYKILLAVLDDNALVGSAHLLTSEVVDGAVGSSLSVDAVDACSLAIDEVEFGRSASGMPVK